MLLASSSHVYPQALYPPNNPSTFQNNSKDLNNNSQLTQESNQVECNQVEANQGEKPKEKLNEKRNPKSFFSDCRVCGQQAKCHNFGVKCCHGKIIKNKMS